MKKYWTLTLPPEGNGSLPVLTRGSSAPKTSTDVNGADVSQLRFKTYSSEAASSDFINIIDDFEWTKSPVVSRVDVPEIYLYEKRILVNNTISNAAYSIFATLDGGATVMKTLGELVDVGSAGIVGDAVESFKKSPTGKYIIENLKKSVDGLTNIVPQFNNPALKPYSGLYLTENTGFNYILPYFDNQYYSATSNYGDGSGSGILTTTLNMVADIGQIATNLAGTIKPGKYIERAKQFNYGDQSRTINIKFPLLNTGKFEDISHNWQFIFGLIYQNRPGRYDKNIIDLPVIYSLEIPGMITMPYAYISSLSIDFVGNRRLMDIPIPDVINFDGTKSLNKIKTIIPDAYQISMSITGLNEETRNFLFAGLQQNQVTVTVNGEQQ